MAHAIGSAKRVDFCSFKPRPPASSNPISRLCRACDGQLALQLTTNHGYSSLYRISPLDLPTAAIGIDITVQVDSHT
ncbi:hypothetical protein PILCRDRAFT_201 [Piloderma croceum F 1598]|uniref:Uncharacterized protein n=1 Tax=Piloderma croceum (strain F 1598) TaxID=765440 RepID=A0A0C3GNG4_PILCF|nr:hypothetical protein PILCRDRAFT_201 [Piloderma croceum F 1598]